MASKNPTTVSHTERELILERVFEAPRELVFNAFIDEKHLARWFGPEGWSTTTYKMEAKTGGEWFFCMRSEEGQESWGKAKYIEVNPHSKIVYTDWFADKDGNVMEGWPVATVSMEFIEEGAFTRLKNRTVYETEKDLQAVLDMGVIEGAGSTWDQLEKYLEEIQKGN
jgi:uncharacterized protein YndB with AHSA1/START domain